MLFDERFHKSEDGPHVEPSVKYAFSSSVGSGFPSPIFDRRLFTSSMSGRVMPRSSSLDIHNSTSPPARCRFAGTEAQSPDALESKPGSELRAAQ
jgi:hypothetical protein